MAGHFRLLEVTASHLLGKTSASCLVSLLGTTSLSPVQTSLLGPYSWLPQTLP
jgi:hypothetical protein